jgi:hypothetical protein
MEHSTVMMKKVMTPFICPIAPKQWSLTDL